MKRCGAPHEGRPDGPYYAGLGLAVLALALGVGLAWLGAAAQQGTRGTAAVSTPPRALTPPAPLTPVQPAEKPPPAKPTLPPEAQGQSRPASALNPAPAPGNTSVLERVPLTRPVVALTLDLGETATRPATQAILDYLAAHHLHCTFFVTGWFIRTYPDLLAEIARQGHDLGNHTDKHPHCTRIPADRLRAELTTVETLLAGRGLAVSTPKYWRPPYGEYNAEVVKTAAGLGYTTVAWSATSVDYNETGDAQKEASRILKRTGPGTIILCHTGPVSQQVVPLVVEPLLKKGYRFATVQGLVEAGLPRRAARVGPP